MNTTSRLRRWFYLSYHSLLFFWQRRTRGFADSDLWNLDMTFITWMLPRLQRFRAVSDGCTPMSMSIAEWDTILGKIERALLLLKQSDCGIILPPDENKEVTEGMQLFGKYVRWLWW